MYEYEWLFKIIVNSIFIWIELFSSILFRKNSTVDTVFSVSLYICVIEEFFSTLIAKWNYTRQRVIRIRLL